jgi:hypothetical protein
MPYFRCPNCALLVHVAADDSAAVGCSRCRVQLQEELDPAPREELVGMTGRPTRKPSDPFPS